MKCEDWRAWPPALAICVLIVATFAYALWYRAPEAPHVDGVAGMRVIGPLQDCVNVESGEPCAAENKPLVITGPPSRVCDPPSCVDFADVIAAVPLNAPVFSFGVDIKTPSLQRGKAYDVVYECHSEIVATPEGFKVAEACYGELWVILDVGKDGWVKFRDGQSGEEWFGNVSKLAAIREHVEKKEEPESAGPKLQVEDNSYSRPALFVSERRDTVGALPACADAEVGPCYEENGDYSAFSHAQTLRTLRQFVDGQR